jgi:hypothetical protein
LPSWELLFVQKMREVHASSRSPCVLLYNRFETWYQKVFEFFFFV